jgi:transcriptional regulator
MYIPPDFRNSNSEELFAFMQAHSFAVLTMNGAEIPFATHLPIVADIQNGILKLISHLSIANPQAKALVDGAEVLVIFTGPHAYISPSNYEKPQNVPTWNYIAVHARGKVKPLRSEGDARRVLEQMIATYEPAYQAQWESLDPKYIDGMLRGILAFEIEVTGLEGQYKMSQNKTHTERENITQSLSQSTDEQAVALAKLMQERESPHHSL